MFQRVFVRLSIPGSAGRFFFSRHIFAQNTKKHPFSGIRYFLQFSEGSALGRLQDSCPIPEIRSWQSETSVARRCGAKEFHRRAPGGPLARYGTGKAGGGAMHRIYGPTMEVDREEFCRPHTVHTTWLRTAVWGGSRSLRDTVATDIRQQKNSRARHTHSNHCSTSNRNTLFEAKRVWLSETRPQLDRQKPFL